MKKTPKSHQETTSLGLQSKTLPRLDDSRLQKAAGGSRIHIPVGFADDGTPIYGDTAG